MTQCYKNCLRFAKNISAGLDLRTPALNDGFDDLRNLIFSDVAWFFLFQAAEEKPDIGYRRRRLREPGFTQNLVSM